MRQFDHTAFLQGARTGYGKLYALSIPDMVTVQTLILSDAPIFTSYMSFWFSFHQLKFHLEPVHFIYVCCENIFF